MIFNHSIQNTRAKFMFWVSLICFRIQQVIVRRGMNTWRKWGNEDGKERFCEGRIHWFGIGGSMNTRKKLLPSPSSPSIQVWLSNPRPSQKCDCVCTMWCGVVWINLVLWYENWKIVWMTRVLWFGGGCAYLQWLALCISQFFHSHKTQLQGHLCLKLLNTCYTSYL